MFVTNTLTGFEKTKKEKTAKGKSENTAYAKKKP